MASGAEVSGAPWSRAPVPAPRVPARRHSAAVRRPVAPSGTSSGSLTSRYRPRHSSWVSGDGGSVPVSVDGGGPGGWGGIVGALPATQVALITHARFSFVDAPHERVRGTDGTPATPRGRAYAAPSDAAAASDSGGDGRAILGPARLDSGGSGVAGSGSGEGAALAGSPRSAARLPLSTRAGVHLSAALYGLVSTLILLPVILGYSSMLVGLSSPATAPLLGSVSSLQFLAQAVAAAVYFLFDTATHASVGTIQDPAIIFYNSAVHMLGAQCAADGATLAAAAGRTGAGGGACDIEVLSGAVLLAVCIGTAATAVACLALSFLPRVVQLVTYVPLPVVGGFLASIGAFILQGGLSLGLVAVDPGGADPAGWMGALASVTSPVNALPMALTAGFGAVLFVAVRLSSHPVVLPALIVLPAPLVYLVLAATGVTFQDAVDAHLFLDVGATSFNTTAEAAAAAVNATASAGSAVYPPVVAAIVSGRLAVAPAWQLLMATPGLLALLVNMVVAVVVATLLLNTLGVETSLGLTLDYRKELRLLAGSNCAGALVGSVPSARNYTLTLMTHAGLKRGAGPLVKSRGAGITTCIVFLLVYLFELPILAAVPKFLFAGVLVFVGADLLTAWLLAARSKLGTLDFAVVWVSFVAIQALGINTGMAIAFLCSVLLFLVQYARVSVIKRVHNRRANRFRLASERAVLARLEGSILLYRVEGVLFFGTARQLVSVVTIALDAVDEAVAAQARRREAAGAAAVADQHQVERWASGDGSGTGSGSLRRRRRRGARDQGGEAGGGDGRDTSGGGDVVAARFVIFDCALLQGLDSSATQTFMRLRRQVNARGVVLVMCALPPHIERTLRREGVLTCDPGTAEPKALSFASFDAAAEWCEDRLLDVPAPGSTDVAGHHSPHDGRGTGAAPTDASTSVVSSVGAGSVTDSPAHGVSGAAASTRRDKGRTAPGAAAGGTLMAHDAMTSATGVGVAVSAIDDGGARDATDPGPEIVESFRAFLDEAGVRLMLQRYTTRREFDTGELVFEDRTPAHSIFFVAEGHVVLLRRMPEPATRVAAGRSQRGLLAGRGSSGQDVRSRGAVVPSERGGQRVVFQSVTPGGIVGDLDMLLQETRSFEGSATEPSVLFELTRVSYERMEREEPALAFALTKVQLRDMCAHIKDVSFRRLLVNE